MIKEHIKDLIKSHALKESPRECCGLILQDGKKTQAFPCRNSSEKPKSHFSVHPADYVAGSLQGNIKAVYHSHNSDNENFSTNDKFHSSIHELDYVLYNTVKDSFSLFNYKKNKTFFYDRIFEIGKSDCYTVIKEYYKELGINLADEPHNRTDHTWHKRNPTLIQGLFNLNKNNPELPICELPPSSELKKHDVVVFEFVKGAGPNHVAVYLGDGTMTHHPRNKYPCIENLNQIYRKKIYKIYRHEGL